MSKIIIHNETDLSDKEALKFVQICYEGIDKYSFWEFMNGHRVQFIQQKTCKTFYVYGGKEVENE